MSFEAFFREGANSKPPRPFQVALAESPWPETRVIPTGFGKTAAVLAAWIWKIAHADPSTPRRLVYCLPMRTLVEQTEAVAKKWIAAAARTLATDIKLDVLMGGHGEGRRGLPGWITEPERPAIIIGTQDMLVSAALMRAYGCSRFRWPVDFALLNNDALWVFDEVQLTGASLPTSVQLEAFRRKFGVGRECRTLWMSATLDPAWLKTVDFTPEDKYRPHDLTAADLAASGKLWLAKKTVQQFGIDSAQIGKKDGLKAYAAALAKETSLKVSAKANTIVFLNTVGHAQAVFDALKDAGHCRDIVLVHSRFRKGDRDARTKQIGDVPPPEGRIIVATQALEAGVDVSSATLITEIAPWSSLVQRFGRCNRYGECGDEGADIFWIDVPDEDARPYEPSDFAEARAKLAILSACGPADLAPIPPSAPPRGQVIRKRDLLDLFDTEPDLSGFDVDVSVYVRDSDDTDVRLFWRSVAEDVTPPADAPEPSREELCPAPIGGAKSLLERKGVRAWRWDPLIKQWCDAKKDEIFPGLVIWVDARGGGYDSERGFDATAKGEVQPVRFPDEAEPEASMDDDPDARGKVRVSLGKHSGHVRQQAIGLAKALGLEQADHELVSEAALWHDLGKAHEAFIALTQRALSDGTPPPLAKWPKAKKGEPRPKTLRKYFRHEVASALGYLANRDWSEKASLTAYLIAAHHGKVRMRLSALPQERTPEDGRLYARGVWDGDELPETKLDTIVVPKTKLDLDLMQLGEGRCGSSWSARTQGLLATYGPFRLAWLEALVRIADWRASAAEDAVGHDDL